MNIGYALVSYECPSLHLQIDALEKAGCQRIYSDNLDGRTYTRSELDRMEAELREGDVVIVWKLDRLGRNLWDLFSLVGHFQTKGVGFKSIQDNIDSTTPHFGEVMFQLLDAVCEFEHNLDHMMKIQGIETILSENTEDRSRLAESLFGDFKDHFL